MASDQKPTASVQRPMALDQRPVASHPPSALKPRKSKSEMRDSAPMRISNANVSARPHMSVERPQERHPRPRSIAVMPAKERAKADALIASTSSLWYAGAAFDRSPDAHTLPKPTKLLSDPQEAPSNKSPSPLSTSSHSHSHSLSTAVARNVETTSLATSYPTPSRLADRALMRPTQIATPPSNKGQASGGDLRMQPRDLPHMLRNGNQQSPPTGTSGRPAEPDPRPRSMSQRGVATATVTATATATVTAVPSSPSPSSRSTTATSRSEDLEEMTRQVRKLLNISQ